MEGKRRLTEAPHVILHATGYITPTDTPVYTTAAGVIYTVEKGEDDKRVLFHKVVNERVDRVGFYYAHKDAIVLPIWRDYICVVTQDVIEIRRCEPGFAPVAMTRFADDHPEHAPGERVHIVERIVRTIGGVKKPSTNKFVFFNPETRAFSQMVIRKIHCIWFSEKNIVWQTKDYKCYIWSEKRTVEFDPFSAVGIDKPESISKCAMMMPFGKIRYIVFPDKKGAVHIGKDGECDLVWDQYTIMNHLVYTKDTPEYGPIMMSADGKLINLANGDDVTKEIVAAAHRIAGNPDRSVGIAFDTQFNAIHVDGELCTIQSSAASRPSLQARPSMSSNIEDPRSD